MCASCEVPLQEEPPQRAPERGESVELVTVLESGDPGVLAVAKSLLEEAGVPYRVRGEGLQDLFGAGRMGTGFSPIIGPVAIQVDRTDAAVAATLLAALVQPSGPTPEPDGGEWDDAAAEDTGAQNGDR